MPRCLNVGCGPKVTGLPREYAGWQEVRLDIDPGVEPDILLDGRGLLTLPGGEYDAVFCSHNLEHYHRHHGAEVLRGMAHVLKPDGFADVRVPDIEVVIHSVVARRLDLDDVLYTGAAGPILVRDVLWGYHIEIERSGQDFYGHRTGYTRTSIAKLGTQCGFAEVIAVSDLFNLNALMFKQPPTREQRTMLGLP